MKQIPNSESTFNTQTIKVTERQLYNLGPYFSHDSFSFLGTSCKSGQFMLGFMHQKIGIESVKNAFIIHLSVRIRSYFNLRDEPLIIVGGGVMQN